MNNPLMPGFPIERLRTLIQEAAVGGKIVSLEQARLNLQAGVSEGPAIVLPDETTPEPEAA